MTRIVVLGDVNLDVSVLLPGAVPRGGEVRTAITNSFGGAAVNFARAAARDGAEVALIGCIGNDPIGDAMLSILERDGIESHLKRVALPTGTIISLVDGAERTMLCSRGANDGLDGSFIDPAWFEGAAHLHLSGYALLSRSQAHAACKAISIANEQGMSISLTAPPANLIAQFGVRRFLAAVGSIDWLFLNLSEGRVITRAVVPDEIVTALAARFPVGALTLGPDGSLAWAEGSRDRVKGNPIEDVDTTGAGDAFAAGFVVSYLSEQDLGRANRRGTAVSRSLLQSRISSV